MAVKLYFATNNLHKVAEVQKILIGDFEILSLKDLGNTIEIPETGDTLEENSRLKVRYLYDTYGLDCFADDTGLEVEALSGAPGVHSARYAGTPGDDRKNVDMLLENLKNAADRNARFRTVITLITDGREKQFEGVVNGKIINERRGNSGFGYDPVFVPNGYVTTFAEMAEEEKNRISHRGISIRKFADFLLSSKK
ncbi:MAG: non-canonical purine NTP diphosphatase [Bacteroidetes bacterium]|nr:non-canonical purine NTP diphosphatase [Bacteroidota bacterium]